MDPERWKQIEGLFNSAMALPAVDRRSFLEIACGSDKDLLHEIESLIVETEDDSNWLSHSAFSLGNQLLGNDGLAKFEGQTVGSYRVLKSLGKGGTSEVFLAEDVRLGRFIALKLMPTSLLESESSATRFQQEARATSTISHPNIAHVYDFGQVDDCYYLAMEYVEGKTLRSLLESNALTFDQTIDIVLQVSLALTAAHNAGIVHRDIKPENIMLRGDGYVKVLDFGLAKFIRNNNSFRDDEVSLDTAPGLLMGTTSYMSPEQLRTGPVDQTTDIWSLGVVMFEMLTGARPFDGKSRSDISAAILLSQPSFDSFNSKTSAILEKCLEKESHERYQCAEALVADLKLLSGASMNRNRERFKRLHRLLRAWQTANYAQQALLVITTLLLFTICSSVLVVRLVRNQRRVHADLQTLVHVCYFDYNYAPDPGRRDFYRDANGIWVERQSNGHENVFREIGKGNAEGTEGILIRNVLTNLELVIPEREGKSRRLFFRIVPVQTWSELGTVVYESDHESQPAVR